MPAPSVWSGLQAVVSLHLLCKLWKVGHLGINYGQMANISLRKILPGKLPQKLSTERWPSSETPKFFFFFLNPNFTRAGNIKNKGAPDFYWSSKMFILSYVSHVTRWPFTIFICHVVHKSGYPLFADCLLMPDWDRQVSRFACPILAPFSENHYYHHSQKCGILTQRPYIVTIWNFIFCLIKFLPQFRAIMLAS